MRRIVRNIVSLLCVLALFIACNEGWRYLLVDDTSSYTRLAMHQMYTSDENIDVAFVGSSHVYRAIIPEIADEKFRCNTFNLGTSSQYMDGSLAIIKELISNNDVKQIYLEMYYDIAVGPENNERTLLTSTYLISDYMKPSFRKLSYILNASSKEHWVDGLILGRRNWDKFFDSDYVRNLIVKKNTNTYKNYEWVVTEGQTEYYVDKGYVASEKSSEEVYWNSLAYNPIDIDSISEDWKDSLQKIIDLCAKKEIELILFVAPMPEQTIVGIKNYNEYSQVIRKIADAADLKFYDFNLVNNKYFSTADNTFFKDADHLNLAGAKAFSTLFCDFFTGKISETDLFHVSLAEKLSNEPPFVYGVSGLIKDETAGVNHARIISNRTNGIEYQIIATPNDGGQRVIQNFSENIDFVFPISETGKLNIVWRTKESPIKTNKIELQY